MTRTLILIVALAVSSVAQKAGNRYEVETLMNPNSGGKDTREVNSVLLFGEKSLTIASRRDKGTFKEFQYADIKMVEHSYSRQPYQTEVSRTILFGLMTGLPVYYPRKDKHWLTLMTGDDFAVLKIENDNFRLIRMEFLVRQMEFVNVDENR